MKQAQEHVIVHILDLVFINLNVIRQVMSYYLLSHDKKQNLTYVLMKLST